MYEIAAIPTRYNGVNFRSRLEARWAAFFDLCGRRWAYEPFDIEGYIPDFMLYGKVRNALVEIKPSHLFDESSKQIVTGAAYSKHHGFRFVALFEDFIPYTWQSDGKTFNHDNWFRCGQIASYFDGVPEDTFTSATAWSDNTNKIFEIGAEDLSEDTLDGEWVHPWNGIYFLNNWLEAGNRVQWSPCA
jgi:hypothetical protein